MEENLEGAKKFKEAFDPDFVKIMTDGLFFMPFNYEDIQCAADLRNLKATEDMDLYFERTIQFVKDLRAIYGNDVLMYYSVFSPVFQINHRMDQTHPGKFNSEVEARLLLF